MAYLHILTTSGCIPRTAILVEAQPMTIPMLNSFPTRTDFSSGSWHQSWRLTRLIPGRESGGFLVTNSWHTSLMEVIRRSAVEVGSWNPIYFAKFYTILVVSRISSINSMNLSSLSWCGSQLMWAAWWLMDSSSGFATLRCLKKRKNIIPNGALMVIYHGTK